MQDRNVCMNSFVTSMYLVAWLQTGLQRAIMNSNIYPVLYTMMFIYL
jgi:uncharacterized protein YqkB